MYTRTDCGILDYYYEVIRMSVTRSGYYTVHSESNINTYGYIYKDHFDPINPSVNKYLENDNDCDNNQFKFVTHLESNTTYILVVTTSAQKEIGGFSILVSGPKNVTFTRISGYTFAILPVITSET